jgi:uncharacterized membrane protein
MLGELINIAAPIIINILELIGMFIITYTSLQCFIEYLRNKLNPDNRAIKIRLAQGIALALEFKLASEIIKTVIVRDIAEIYVLGAIIIIRVILTFVIQWEIKTERDAQ